VEHYLTVTLGALSRAENPLHHKPYLLVPLHITLPLALSLSPSSPNTKLQENPHTLRTGRQSTRHVRPRHRDFRTGRRPGTVFETGLLRRWEPQSPAATQFAALDLCCIGLRRRLAADEKSPHTATTARFVPTNQEG
jgi:hypothetical protein